jgi:hypothetical protein
MDETSFGRRRTAKDCPACISFQLGHGDDMLSGWISLELLESCGLRTQHLGVLVSVRTCTHTYRDVGTLDVNRGFRFVLGFGRVASVPFRSHLRALLDWCGMELALRAPPQVPRPISPAVQLTACCLKCCSPVPRPLLVWD